MKIGKYILTFVAIIAFGGIYLYRPIKEERVYTRGIELSESLNLQENVVSEEAIILKGKSILEDILSIKIDENDYDITVDYDNIAVANYNNSYEKQEVIMARVNFDDIYTEGSVYMITYNTNSGEVVQLFQESELIEGDYFLPEEQLEQLSKKLCSKIAGVEESEIIYFQGDIISENYSSTIILNKSYYSIIIDLNPYTGELIYYYKNY